MNSILSLNKLAFTLGISRKVLEDVGKNRGNYYRPYSKKEPKADGSIKHRRIDNPSKAINKIQKSINKHILRERVESLPAYMTGSIRSRSVKHNATPHVLKEGVLAIDITNCFPSISSSMVYSLYRKEFGCSPSVAKVLTKLTTYGDRLPQGAPTSPSLCNLILKPMAEELFELAQENELHFTQYVDDLTFSGNVVTLRTIKPTALAIIRKNGFKVNIKKLKLLQKNERMSVTGLVVNKGLSVGRSYIREVQRDILRKRSTAIVNGKIAFVQLVSKRSAKRLKAKSVK